MKKSVTETLKNKTENRPGLDLYRKLYLIRQAERLIIRHYPEDQMKTPMHMSMGQEATATAVCHALVTGSASGRAGSMHLAAPDKGLLCTSAVVASSIPLAVGAAFANKRKGNGRIACAFFGDGALEEGVFWESLNAASVMKLPVLFVCEDNGLAIHTKQDVRQGFKSITEVVRNFECSTFQSDSTDVEVLYRLVRQAVEAIGSEGRPSFLHLKCYRYLDHIGIQEDFDLGYRSKEEFEEWFKRDTIALQRKRLLSQGWSEAELAEEEEKINRHLEKSLRNAQAAPFPPSEDLHRGVFYETH
ncbi:MAG: thiamine pyrophosphate-dependent dehydrogenase E1 component subunit alpha [Candidatus Omnitrophica bacterium]|nr:thiamine pyrophosphate-dependent dehydrogenase E1 component subunit alpha [Candidatus Omnitrophota bacterium]